MLKMKAESTGGWNPHVMIHVAAFDGITEHPTEIATGLVMAPAPTDGLYYPAPITLRRNEAQLLMDSLWECGLRPSEGTGSAGAMAATERHLRDLQRIIFTTPVIAKDEP